ncbi:hypothetical protein MMC19_000220 [Ptychographa xylographoides]|nr:hypothetical protein [Ptychographa xylographoides]
MTSSNHDDPRDEAIPTYEESISQGAIGGPATESKTDTQSGQPAFLPGQLSTVREQRINNIIQAYIDPLLQEQSLSGLSKTTFVLVPSNTSTLQSPKKGSHDIIEGTGDSLSHDNQESIVGFPSADYVKLVRLHGAEYNIEFWRQPAVIKELDSALKARLQASGHRMADDSPPQPVSPAVPDPPKAKRGFFGQKPKPAPVASQAPINNWRFAEGARLDPDHVRVKVGLQEVCIRVVTDMGLYETRTGKAVVVNIEIGA